MAQTMPLGRYYSDSEEEFMGQEKRKKGRGLLVVIRANRNSRGNQELAIQILYL